MIDIRKLKELVRLMVANDLTELDLRDTEEQVTLRRPGSGQGPAVVAAPPPVAPPAVAAPAPDGAAAAAAEPVPAAGAVEARRIESPMVGTFYDKPNPDAEPFVVVGSRVEADTVICLVEAMKIFNEIKAECTGTVHRVLVSSGDAVEFGQPLFEIKPD